LIGVGALVVGEEIGTGTTVVGDDDGNEGALVGDNEGSGAGVATLGLVGDGVVEGLLG